MIEITLGQILFAVGFVWISFHCIKETIERQKIINQIAENMAKEQPEKLEEFIFVDELEDLSPEHTLLAENEQEENESLFYL